MRLKSNTTGTLEIQVQMVTPLDAYLPTNQVALESDSSVKVFVNRRRDQTLMGVQVRDFWKITSPEVFSEIEQIAGIKGLAAIMEHLQKFYAAVHTDTESLPYHFDLGVI